MKAKKLISALMLLAIAGATATAATVTGCKNTASGGGGGGGGKTYYVAPDGTDDAAGTEADPLSIYRLLHTQEVSSKDIILKAGDTVMVKPGDYEMAYNQRIIIDIDGTFDKPITIKNADPTQKATLKFYDMEFSSLNRGVQIYGDHFIWDGVDIAGAGDNGLYIGGSYNVVQNCEFYDNRDTGLQLGRSYSDYNNINQWPHYNLIKNCTSYNNYDNETYGENADGFAAKLTVGYGNVFDGCIAYRNSDDGWDLYAKTDSGNIGQVIMYNCVAYENGFIMEPQETFNAKFPRFRPSYAEAVTNSYTTRDGDGNGFKLGGSTMEGEVLLENCLSFHNRMHGVTDNSNPGVITINGVTSYNNAASVDNNPTSLQFGYIMYGLTGADECANIDLARHNYSYNHVANTLSVSTASNVNVNADAYRGTMENSKLWGPSASYTISGQAEYNSKTGDRGASGAMLVDTEVFKVIPAMNMGISKTAHKDYRNADGSVNMGEILAQKDGSSTYGSFVNKSSWEDYTHFDYVALNNCRSKDDAIATAVEKMLYVPIRTEACYQDFKAVTAMLEKATITWSSSDSSLLKVTDIKGTSNSHHEDVTIEVIRPAEADKTAVLTATIKVGNVTKTKTFEINVKQNTYRIGEFIIDGLDKNGTMIVDKGENKFDYRVKAPAVINDTSNSGVLIDPSNYTRNTYYKLGTVLNPDFSKTPAEGGWKYMDGGFDAREAGIWEITETVTLKDGVVLGKSLDGSGPAPTVQQKSYRIFVAATNATVDFAGVPKINANRDGFSIEGDVTSPTGTLYTKTVAKGAAAPTAQEIVDTGVENPFRATSIFFNVAQSNDAAYDIYYVMKNVDGTITTATPGKQTVEISEIATKAEFEAMLANNNSTTIYKLTADIDFGGTVTTSAVPFVGVFNGMGHKLSNVKINNTVASSDDDAGAGIFRLVRGGTIMNVTFENIEINDVGKKTGIISLMNGGYASNIKVHNVRVISAERTGALIGQITAPSTSFTTNYIDRIEIINDDEYVEVQNVYKQTTATVTAEDFVKGNIKYYVFNEGKYTLATEFVEGTTYYEFVSGADALHFERGKYYELVGEEYVRCDDYKADTVFYEQKWVVKGNRSGGIVGFIQAGKDTGYTIVHISDCYVDLRIESGDYCGGIVGRSDDRNVSGLDELHILNCYYNGEISCLKRAGGMLGGFTGKGITRIKSCLSLGIFYYADPRELVTTAQKNCSGILGNYAGNADMEVEGCYAMFEEHNADYDVEVVILVFLENKTINYFKSDLEFDMTNIWEFVDDENDETKYKAPYIKLR